MSRYSKLVLTIIAVCLLWICLREVSLWPRAHAAGKVLHAELVTARMFAIMDSTGKIRGRFGVNPNGEALLSLAGKRGDINILMSVTKQDTPLILLVGPGRKFLWNAP